ncbi:PREDICTED: stigma-specific STIG1-like protein 1 [Camelina sativa]|uniref:Stigma-specific STIG1-like protein 1 n=1 Tax=Camelina sativa TaxID=90675 RepID=A0ABM0UBE8_CAMSA|nr:PREDICTED: stigma-specific STIG1-like protein 1 [Camelina sativa]
MALLKLLVTIAITTAITIAVITTRTTTTTNVEHTSFDVPVTLTIRPSRFLAQKEVGERNPNAADHCNKDPEICNLNGGGGSNSTVTCCNNKCIDVSNDDKNCGACKNKCKFSQTCCRGQCIYLAYDKRHCGQCNNLCALGEFCVYGLCNYA